MQDTLKTSYWQDTNVYISENKQAEDLKIGHYTGNIFFFLLLRCNSSRNWMQPSENWRICQ